MSVTVISKRVFTLKHKEKIIPLLKQLRNHAKKQKGFISRATHKSLNNPDEHVVISLWKTVGHWEKWMAKKKTCRLQGDIDSMIGEKTVFDIYEPDKF